ncbi:MAG: hypothetical protein ACJ77M_04245 [Thermoleophilaceae bacterium]
MQSIEPASPEARRAARRREAELARIRRRRRLTPIGVAVAIGAIAAVVIVATGGGEKKHHPRPADATMSVARGLAAAMAKPWPAVQTKTGHFRSRGGGSTRYGDSMVGYGLIQEGLREKSHALIESGLRGIGYALTRARKHASPSVFEGLALAGAYNIAREELGSDPGFTRIRAAWEDELRHITVIRLPATRYYGNHWLVEAVEVRELLRSGLTSTDKRAVLGGLRGEADRLSADLVNRRIPQMARDRSVGIHGRRVYVLSDPPDDPPAYQGLSLGMYARAIRLLGDRASGAARRTLIQAGNASLWMTGPDGDVAWAGRNEEEAWALGGTAYGAAVIADLTRTGARTDARYRTLAARTLERLRRVHGVGQFGLNITPAVRVDPVAGERGVDPGAGGPSFAGLTLTLVDWALPELARGRHRFAPTPADRNGGAVLDRGESQFAVVRHGPLWYVVKSNVSGKHPYELRDDFGLLAMKVRTAKGWIDVARPRPITSGKPDSAGPVLESGPQAPGFPFGDSMRVAHDGSVVVDGGFRTRARTFTRVVAKLPNGTVVNALDFYPGTTVRSGVTFRFSPDAACRGLAVSWPTRTGDVFDYSDFVIPGGPPTATANPKPAAVKTQSGYASGLDPRLNRVRMRFNNAGGRPITVSKCSAAGSPSSSSRSPSP